MNPLNPLNDPNVIYLRAFLGSRIDRARDEERSRGASAIEWAIITGILAAIAIAIGAVIYRKVEDASSKIKVGTGTVG